MSDRTVEAVVDASVVDEVVRELTSSPLGYVVDDTGTLWPPSTAHDQHRYEFNCALCRSGDRPAALDALISRVLSLAAARTDRCDSSEADRG